MSRLRDSHNRIYEALQTKQTERILINTGIAVAPKADRYRNKTERAYAQTYLQPLLHAGQIREWKYESHTFRLADGSRYTPDFYVVLPDDVQEFHEIKGFMREAARVRFLVARELFPAYRWRMIYRERGQWLEKLL